MCKVLQVSRSGYYTWSKKKPSIRYEENEKLKDDITRIFQNSGKRYGIRRITKELQHQEKHYNKKRIARLFKILGFIAKATPKKFKRSKTKKSQYHGITDLVKQDFSSPVMNRVWSSDITYLWTKQGWVYLAVVLDLYSRKIVGYAVSKNINATLVVTALKRALFYRRVNSETIFHSDRGSQFISNEVKTILEQHQIRQSMGEVGTCYDNAITESFFHTLKIEAIYGEHFDTAEELEQILFEYIEIFYNKQRMHSALGYVSPEHFEQQAQTKIVS
jgi:putative transposase